MQPVFDALLAVNSQTGRIGTLRIQGDSYLQEESPLFQISMMDEAGRRTLLSSDDAAEVMEQDGFYAFNGFPLDISVRVYLDRTEKAVSDGLLLGAFRIEIENHTALLIESVDFPGLTLPALARNGGRGSLLFPYNEGALVDDIKQREASGFRHYEPEYPSHGSYAVFPNMVCSQFLCYLQNGFGLYIGAEDPERGVKMIDFCPSASGDGVRLITRIFTGVYPGDDYVQPYPIVLRAFRGDWMSGASIYRQWLEGHLPEGLRKVPENADLPDWYLHPFVVATYPVRGIHDMDTMNPNRLFPYVNALPLIREISRKVGCPVMSLLMHWEGSAPWAPPYVWPPYGGEKAFFEFRDQLHAEGNLLGVYCSGFGYTIQSNLIDSYNCQAAIDRDGLMDSFCASPANKVEISAICTGQRSGYDLCIEGPQSRRILDEAYQPLFHAGIDYAQILDQNHGGGQYFCYSRDHGHAPCPGPWMTESMRSLLRGWKKDSGKMLLGCESSAAEPFISALSMSDNRYELNYHIGRPVPLFAWLYHEYAHNFMGNQVSLGLDGRYSLCYRMAYSFSIGDVITLVMTPDGQLMRSWGDHNFENLPDKETALKLLSNLIRLHRTELAEAFSVGRMIRPEPYTSRTVSFDRVRGEAFEDAAVLSSAWESPAGKQQLFVNHTEEAQEISFRGQTICLPPLDGLVVAL